MSRLDAFRKHAKQLVRWHREGHHSIGGRIRTLPRYEHLTDVEALQLPFSLGEAQEIIAREAGFESWAALKAATLAADPSARLVTDSVPMLKAAIPNLFVADVRKSAEFFERRLGFTIDFLHGHPPFYGSVSRDGVALHLRFVHKPVISQELREGESLLAAFVVVANVKALFAEYKTKDVPFAETLHKEPWGGPTFTVGDLDGNRICFCDA